MKHRFSLLIIDAIVLTGVLWLSSVLFPVSIHLWLGISFLFIAFKIALSLRFGLYHAILRFAGLPLASSILLVMAIADIGLFMVDELLLHKINSPGFFVLDYLLSTFFVGMTRFAPRYFSEARQEKGSKKVLIYGAGDLGEDVARKLLRNPEEYQMVGFLDDSKDKIGKRLHNFPIYGPINRLEKVLAKTHATEIIIAISALEGSHIRQLTRHCRNHRISCRIVPSFPHMLQQDVDIKNIDIADLLKRDPKDLDEPQIKRFIQGKSVLITGAGGSIGSELARQCIKYGASKLTFIDHSEFNLYSLEQEVRRADVDMAFCLVNILSRDSVEKIIASRKPAIILHAAAYKHVPLVEENPYEGAVNNILGTVHLAQLAEKCGVDKFVLISTDKAVRPTNVMGATKRIAELYIQNLNVKSRTEYISVRFGNVLGSSGSVVPKFIDQINNGGPVTVTHPEVTRYFMLTSEAVQLVLQAGSIGNGGEVFILNMGEPVKIAEMAEDLIFLSGRQPHKDIKIEYVGLRAGEKLYEELLHDEGEKKTQYENITIGQATYVDWEWLKLQVENCLSAAQKNNYESLFQALKILVPEFMHAHYNQPLLEPNVLPFSSRKSH